MIIYPAIDLKNGQCVRLYQGDMNQATIFNDSPASQARYFEDQGFKFLHIVDLDGAIAGESANEESVRAILQNITIPAQLGGGIRTMADIEKWLDLGIDRVILGTVALKNPDLVIEAAQKFPGRIVVGIDAKNGMVATEGWVENSAISVIDLAKKFESVGVAAIIYTDINRDGTGQGVDFAGTKKLAQNIKIPTIASGGVGSLQDVQKVSQLKEFGVGGVIVGRALYDEKIKVVDLQDFL
jgi:phosphoribosylformimino-5-aminoimidazole carboxamide ribotide isomerase